MTKYSKIKNIEINNEKYWCLEDIATMGGSEDPSFTLSHWLSLPNTVQFLGYLEINNENFNRDEYMYILDKAGLNSFVIRSEDWCSKTCSKSIIRKSFYTYANKFVSIKFASWISVEFEYTIYNLFEKVNHITVNIEDKLRFKDLLNY